jgi:hypothetical protein
MPSAEHFARVLSLQSRGIHVLSWNHKLDLVRALLLLQATLPTFPDAPTLIPTDQVELQRFSLRLFEATEAPLGDKLRIFFIPQASTQAVGGWLNGWRQRLAEPPGTLLVIRHSDLVEFHRRAPDLMSFAESEIDDATILLPLVAQDTLEQMRDSLPDSWRGPLETLPGSMPSDDEIAAWITQLRANAD